MEQRKITTIIQEIFNSKFVIFMYFSPGELMQNCILKYDYG